MHRDNTPRPLGLERRIIFIHVLGLTLFLLIEQRIELFTKVVLNGGELIHERVDLLVQGVELFVAVLDDFLCGLHGDCLLLLDGEVNTLLLCALWRTMAAVQRTQMSVAIRRTGTTAAIRHRRAAAAALRCPLGGVTFIFYCLRNVNVEFLNFEQLFQFLMELLNFFSGTSEQLSVVELLNFFSETSTRLFVVEFLNFERHVYAAFYFEPAALLRFARF